ncbi:MAG: formylmethanofuran dehydrogenase subunit E family protein [Candidatus Methanomethylicia archaeon]
MVGLSFEEAVKLHGHKGPWLVLGYRAGLYAREFLKPTGIHDLYCIIHVPMKRPYTCIIDGVQAAACCTLGKLNIEVVNSESNLIRLIFINTKTSRKIELKLRENVAELINSLIKDLAGERDLENITDDVIEDVADEIWRRNIWELFEKL